MNNHKIPKIINIDYFIAYNPHLRNKRFIPLSSLKDRSDIYYYDCLELDIKVIKPQIMTAWRDEENYLSSIISYEDLFHMNNFPKYISIELIEDAQNQAIAFYFAVCNTLENQYKNVESIEGENISALNIYFKFYQKYHKPPVVSFHLKHNNVVSIGKQNVFISPIKNNQQPLNSTDKKINLDENKEDIGTHTPLHTSSYQCVVLFENLNLETSIKERIEPLINLMKIMQPYQLNDGHCNLSLFDNIISFQLQVLSMSLFIEKSDIPEHSFAIFDDIYHTLEQVNEEHLDKILDNQRKYSTFLEEKFEPIKYKFKALQDYYNKN